MNERKEYYGHWWLPDNEGKKVAGILISDPIYGISLYLFEKFTEHFDTHSFSAQIILGETIDGKDITLYQAYLGELDSSSELNLNKLFKYKYVANFVFIGALFKSEQEMNFDTLSVSFTNLDSWINISGFEIGPNSKLLFDTVIAYKNPEPIVLLKNEIFDLRFVTGHSYSMDRHGSETQTVKESFYFLFDFKRDQTFESVNYYFNSLQNFLSLAMNNATYPLNIHLQSKNVGRKLGDGKFFKDDIDFIYLTSSRQKSERHLFFTDMLLPFQEIKDRSSDVFSKYFSSYLLLEDIYGGYFDVLYDSSMALRKQFSYLAQALEAYHALRVNNEEIPKEEYAKRVKEILTPIPEGESKNWLKTQLDFGNKPSLAKRLSDIKTMFSGVFQRFISDDEFFKKVRDNRNYLTHLDVRSKKKAIPEDDLPKIIRGIKMLVEACFLRELGFNVDEIDELIRKNNIHKHFIEN